jgi:hypothetical protein
MIDACCSGGRSTRSQVHHSSTACCETQIPQFASGLAGKHFSGNHADNSLVDVSVGEQLKNIASRYHPEMQAPSFARGLTIDTSLKVPGRNIGASSLSAVSESLCVEYFEQTASGSHNSAFHYITALTSHAPPAPTNRRARLKRKNRKARGRFLSRCWLCGSGTDVTATESSSSQAGKQVLPGTD